MAIHAVVQYTSRWDLNDHKGRIALFDPSNKQLDNRVYTTPDEFQLIVDTLRNEKPLRFDDVQKTLTTGREPVGDDE